MLSLAELRDSQRPGGDAGGGAHEREEAHRARPGAGACRDFPDDSLEAALRRTVAPEFLTGIV